MSLKSLAQPSKVFLVIGINDIGKDIPDAVIAGNDLKIVNEIHAKCRRPVKKLIHL